MARGLGCRGKGLRVCVRRSSQSENNNFTEMCSGSEAGSHLRLIDFVYHSILGLRVIKKKRRSACARSPTICRLIMFRNIT